MDSRVRWLIRKATFVFSLVCFLAFLFAPSPLRWYAFGFWIVPFVYRGYKLAVDQARMLGWL